MNNLFLTDNELIELTDRRRPTAQKKVLRKMGLDFYVSAVGKCKVLRRDVEVATEKHQMEPDFAAV